MSTTGPGARIAGHEVEALLGRGGSGVVYRARDVALGRTVALKVLSPEVVRDLTVRERLLREARVLASLNHPNVVRVHGVREEDGNVVLVLEHVAGGTLRDRVRARGALSSAEAARIGAGIARALEALHAAGLVHRDVKPANVLLDEEDRPRLADFGLARGGTQDRLTATGELVGTPAYLAPELVRGSEPGPAADLYALGCTLHELLAGAPPFDGSAFVVLRKHVAESPPSLARLAPGASAELVRVVERLLAKDPMTRGTARGTAEELERLAAPREAKPAPPARRPALPALAAIGVVAVVAGAFVARGSLAPSRRAQPEARPEPPVVVVAPDAPEVASDVSSAASDALARARSAASSPFWETRAAQAATRAIESDPRRAEAWALRARARVRTRDFALAEEDATRVLGLAPEHPEALILRATARVERAWEARDVGGEAAAEPAGAATTLLALARADAERAHALAPGLARLVLAKIALLQDDAARADQVIRSSDPAIGEELARSREKRRIVVPDATPTRVPGIEPGREKTEHAEHLAEEGKPELAAIVALRVLETQPRSLRARRVRTQARLALDDVDGAAADAERLVLAGDHDGPVARADVRERVHDLAGALADVETAIDLRTRASEKVRPWLRARRAALVRRVGDPDRARALLVEIEERGRAEGEVAGWLARERGNVRWALGDLEGAALDLARFLAEAPIHGGALAEAGWLELERGNARAAAELFQRSARAPASTR